MAEDVGITAALHFGGRDAPNNCHGGFQHGEIQRIEIFLADLPHQGNILLPVINLGESNAQRFQGWYEPLDIGGVQLEKFWIVGDSLGQPVFLIDTAEALWRKKIERVQDEKPPFAFQKNGLTFAPYTEPLRVFLA